MNLFVTGGTSFLGSYFLREAASKGHHLICLRRKGSQPRVSVSVEIEWVELDWEDDLTAYFERADCFVHFLAAGVTPQPIDWETALDINLLRSFKLWQKAAIAGVERFVISGSASEYGSSCQRFEPVPPDAPLEPSGAYAASKACSSILARALARELNLELVYIRAFNLFGEGQYGKNFWPALKAAALAGEDFDMTRGTQVRDFSPVEDAASCFVDWLDCSLLEKGHPRIINFGSGAPKALIEYAREWWASFGAAGELLPGALPQRANELNKVTPLLS